MSGRKYDRIKLSTFVSFVLFFEIVKPFVYLQARRRNSVEEASSARHEDNKSGSEVLE